MTSRMRRAHPRAQLSDSVQQGATNSDVKGTQGRLADANNPRHKRLLKWHLISQRSLCKQFLAKTKTITRTSFRWGQTLPSPMALLAKSVLPIL